MPERCDAHCLVGPASHTTDKRDWIADCILNAGHDGTHHGPLDHAVETYTGGWNTPDFTWADEDRRNYHGEYPGLCDEPGTGCILPLGHRGSHAP